MSTEQPNQTYILLTWHHKGFNLTNMGKTGFTNASLISFYLFNFVLLQIGLCLTWVAFLWWIRSIVDSSPRAYRTSLYRLLLSWQQTGWPHWCSDTQPACLALPAARTRSASLTSQFLPQDTHIIMENLFIGSPHVCDLHLCHFCVSW